MAFKKKVVRRRGRRLSAAAVAAGVSTAVAGSGYLAGLAGAYKKNYKKPTMPPNPSLPKQMRPKKGKVVYKMKMRHANPEGYIPSYSKTIGNPNTSLSFPERVQRIMNPPQTMLYNTTQKIESTSGLQAVNSFNINNLQLKDFFNFITAGRSDVTTTTNSNYNVSQVINRVNHHWTSVQHTFINSSNITAELEIYIFQAIQDIDSGDQAVNASAAWTYSESINGLNGVTADSTSVVGKKPTDFSAQQYLRRYWRLVSTTTVQMKPGESFKHYFRKYYNRQIAQYMLNDDTSACLKNHSLSFVYVQKGQIIGSSLDSTISTGDTQISLYRTVKLQYSYCVNNRARDYQVGTGLTAILPANQVFINTDTSVQTTAYVEDT